MEPEESREARNDEVTGEQKDRSHVTVTRVLDIAGLVVALILLVLSIAAHDRAVSELVGTAGFAGLAILALVRPYLRRRAGRRLGVERVGEER